jgi:hypothetical protein
MSITINLPEDIEHQLKAQWGDVPRRALEPVMNYEFKFR